MLEETSRMLSLIESGFIERARKLECEFGVQMLAFISQLEREDLNGKLTLMSKLSSNIKEVCTLNQKEITEYYYHLLCHVFLSVEPKSPLKNSAARLLMKFPEELRSDIAMHISENLVNMMKSNDSWSVKYSLNKICDCFENFSIGVEAVSLCLSEVLSHINCSLQHTLENLSDDLSPMQQTEFIAVAHSALRATVMIFQKFSSKVKLFIKSNGPNETKCLEDIFCACSDLLNHELIPMDTKLNCGLVIVIQCTFMCNHGHSKVLSKVKCDEPSLISEEGMLENVLFKSKIAHMSVCYGLINVLPIEVLCSFDDSQENYIMDVVVGRLVTLSESTDSSLSLGCSRALQQAIHNVHNALVKRSCSNALVMLENTHILSVCLDFVWLRLDHYMDCVRHAARAMLQDLVQIADILCRTDSVCSSFEATLIDTVAKIPSHKKSRYVALAVLANELGCQKLMCVFPDLVCALLEVLEDPSMSSHVSNAYESLMVKNFREEGEIKWMEVWIFPLFEAYSTSKVCYILEGIICKAMRLCPALLDYVMTSLERDMAVSSKLKVVIVCLKIGTKLGVLDKACRGKSVEQKWKGIIKYENIMKALVNQDDETRISALSLIVESNKTTQSLDVLELELIKYFLWYNINSDSAALKQKNLMLLKKMLTRMWESSYPLLKALKSKDENIIANVKETLSAYAKFLKWLHAFCFKCLFPGANASRCASALEILALIDEIFFTISNDERKELFVIERHKDHAELLFTCLKDSFESNKSLALKIMMKFPAEPLELEDQSHIHHLLNISLKLASSVKPPDCITAAYLLNFLAAQPEAELVLMQEASKIHAEFLPDIIAVARDSAFPKRNIFYLVWILFEQLKNQHTLAKQNLLLAAGSGPMYGTLFSIRYLFKDLDFLAVAGNTIWKSFVLELITLCFELNNSVIHIVNSSSPEGHLPMDFEPANNHGALCSRGLHSLNCERKIETSTQQPPVTAQMLLLCSWRTVKEVSLFLGEISFQAPIYTESVNGELGCYLLSEELVLKIGEHFTQLLSETKHRGAFEQAYVGFCQLCKKLWKHPKGTLSHLPRLWLKDIMNEVTKGTKSIKLCATRRSAGVPFIIQALVTTELAVRQPTCLKESMELLLSLLEKNIEGSEGSTESAAEVESRTHAMNILRAMFRHTLLGELVTPFIARGIVAAIQGFKGNSWAERNSATLLFGALIVRIFGVKHSREEVPKRNRMTGRVFFERFPSLYDFILGELKVASAETIASEEPTSAHCVTRCLHPSLFPLLVILSRLYPSSLEGTDSNIQLSAFVPLVQCCLRSKIYKIRELAARAMVPLITANIYIDHVNQALSLISTIGADQNFLHGILLQVSFLFHDVPYPEKEIEECLCGKVNDWIVATIKILSASKEYSFMVKEAYIRVLRHLLFFSSSFDNCSSSKELWCKVYFMLESQIKHYSVSSDTSDCLKLFGGKTWIHRATQVLLEVSVFTDINSQSLIELLCSFLSEPCPMECTTVVLSFICSVFGEQGCELMEEEDGLPLFVWPRSDLWATKSFRLREKFILENNLAVEVVNLLLCSPNSCLMQRTLRAVGYLARSSVKILWQKEIEPDSFKDFNPISYLIELCQSQPENVGRAALFCLSALVQEIISCRYQNILSQELSTEYCNLLVEFSSVDKSDSSRMVVAEALVMNHSILSSHVANFSVWDQCCLWIALLDLMGDHCRSIREAAAKISTKFICIEDLTKGLQIMSDENITSVCFGETDEMGSEFQLDWELPQISKMAPLTDVMPERLKEILLLHLCKNLESLNKYECAVTLFILALKGESCDENEDGVNEERVFDKAEVNLYAEWFPLAKLCVQWLKKILVDDSVFGINRPIPPILMALAGLEECNASSLVDFIKFAVESLLKKVDICDGGHEKGCDPFLTHGYDMIQREVFKVGFVLKYLRSSSFVISNLYENFLGTLSNSKLMSTFSVF